MNTQLFSTFLLFVLFTLLHAQAKPNVVFILADDMGYGDVVAYGCTDIKTANLDRLAASGSVSRVDILLIPIAVPCGLP